MSTCSHALYLALTTDLQRYLPNSTNCFFPQNLSEVAFEPLEGYKAFAAASLLKSIFKKNVDHIAEDADAKALDLFISMNDKCREFRFDLWSLNEELVHVFTWAKSFIDDTLRFGPDITDPSSWLDECDFGPGASVSAAGNSFLHKVGSGRLSCTDAFLYSVYLESIKGSKTWLTAEKLRRDAFGHPLVVSGSKLCFVPKTSRISRTICTEPSLNMFLQKGLSSCLKRCLNRSISIDLRDQQFRNKRLARIGSRTGEYSTIDLTSASDTISLEIVKYLFPADVFAWLDAARSPRTTLPDGRVLDLHMISSMGNDYTFPLQTMIFSAIAFGVYKVLGIPILKPSKTSDGNIGVFGDDIIVRGIAFNLMCRSLEAAGFIVNKSKSYNVGLFRESCGGDYFDGHNVRGVYCKTLRSTHAKYSLINRLNAWSASLEIPLYNTMSLLLESVRFLPVPAFESDISGVKVPLCLANVKRDSNGSFVYKRLEARKISIDMTDFENSKDHKKHKRYRITANPSAIMVAAIKGTLFGGSLNIRLDVLRPHYRYGVTPCWDHVDLEYCRFGNTGFDVWKQMSLVNFGSRLLSTPAG